MQPTERTSHACMHAVMHGLKDKVKPRALMQNGVVLCSSHMRCTPDLAAQTIISLTHPMYHAVITCPILGQALCELNHKGWVYYQLKQWYHLKSKISWDPLSTQIQQNSPKRQDRQRPIRLVTQPMRHRIAPEIVPEHLPQRRHPEHVLVLDDHAHIVVHELAVHAVRVAHHREQGDNAVGGQRQRFAGLIADRGCGRSRGGRRGGR